MAALKVPFARVDCSGNELSYVREVLESGWLTTAGRAQLLEERFRERVGARFTCAVNSCTAALHLGLEAMGVGAAPLECASLSPAVNSTGHGDKVLVQSMTFTASAEVVRYLGADPVFLDCDPQTRLITPEIVEAAVQEHPDAKVLVVVHFGGHAAQMLDENGRPGLLSVCRKHGDEMKNGGRW